MILTEPLRLTRPPRSTTSTPRSTVAASPARPAPCASASPGRSSSSTPSCAHAQAGGPSSPETLARRKARSTASRRPARPAVLEALVARGGVASEPRLRFGTDGVRASADRAATANSRWRSAAPRRGCSAASGASSAATRASPDRCSRPRSRLGLAAEGAAVTLLGVLPTPAVACASRELDAPAAVISASHNSVRGQRHQALRHGRAKARRRRAGGRRAGDGRAGSSCVGVRKRDERRHVRRRAYVDWLISTMDGRRLDGLTVVIDCANGAAHAVGPVVLDALGADVVVINAEPDGRNINDRCGSTASGAVREAVLAAGADVGLAFDGDADRVLAVDAPGGIVDGDQIIAICAIDLRDRGRLTDDTRRGHGDDQPRLPPGHGRRGDRGGRDAGRRPLRARGARRPRAQPRRRAERPRHLP